MTDHAAQTDQTENRIPADTVPVVPADGSPAPSTPAADAAAAPPATEATPAEPVVPTNPRDAARQALAERFKQNRADHEKKFQAPDTPPFIEHERREAEAAAPAADAPPAAEAAPAAADPQPAPEAPTAFTLKIRGRDVKVENRDDLARLAEYDPTEVADFSDDQLRRMAEKVQVAKSYREATPAAAAPSAPAQDAAPPQRQEPSIPTDEQINALRVAKVEKYQYGEPAEAAEAERAYEEAVETRRRAQQNAEFQQRSIRDSVTRDVQSFMSQNQDIVSDADANGLLLMRATREMGDDLIKLGATEQDIAHARTNPAEMTKLYGQARELGVQVRSNADILNAAATAVRTKLKMPAPSQVPQPSNRTAERVAEKRSLPAQPQRSSNPPEAPNPEIDIMASRKAALERTRQARKGRNIEQVLGTS